MSCFKGNGHRPDLDGSLAVLGAVARREGFTGRLTLQEIADCCGVSNQAIHAIEKKALQKARVRLIAQGVRL